MEENETQENNWRVAYVVWLGRRERGEVMWCEGEDDRYPARPDLHSDWIHGHLEKWTRNRQTDTRRGRGRATSLPEEYHWPVLHGLVENPLLLCLWLVD